MRIEVKNLTHVYMSGTPFCHTALDDVNLTIEQGEFVGIIGHTGSGKSTLLTAMAGLNKPTSGQILMDGRDIYDKKLDKKWLRSNVGVVFQYPEYQLFEETVEKDIEFGPKKLGLEQDEITKRVIESMALAGIDYDEYRNKSPFELSGGQKRKVAIAGVLALKPNVLFMDEPIAGLDPMSRDALMNMTVELNKKGVTIVMISHNMEGIAEYATRVIAFSESKLMADGTPREVFARHEVIKNSGLELPFSAQLVYELNKRGCDLPDSLIKYDETLSAIINSRRENR